ncbi:MAG: hypothetical protein GTO22_07750 [Gemmatimonadales bacterium]|nr:hypothetical protein [Gemmatimonadales bacterium]
MARHLAGPHDPAEMQRFLDSFMYREEAFFLDEIVRLDGERRELEARLDTNRYLPLAQYQRIRPEHPAHVSGAELIMVTASMGCVHAWFFYGCRWDEGWVGFGNRIHRADFKAVARIGPPLELRSHEIRSRAGARRVTIRFEFEFRQGGELVYYGDQSAMFVQSGR